MDFVQKLSVLLVFLTFSLQYIDCLLDPVSLGVGASIGFGIYGYGFLKEQTYCRMTECCNERSIPANIGDLKARLQRDLFGQHIVQQKLIPALKAHFSSNSLSRKPLVISFHGTPGTGKNYVADMIAETLYEKGLKSRFVHKYSGRSDFVISDFVYSYKNRIKQEVLEGIADCPRSLFIFDEVDKMPEGVFESLTSLVDYNALPSKLDSSKAIFIFISNTAGVQISDLLGKLIRGGALRDETKLSEFEQILEKVAYNLDGGLKKTSLIEAHVIDHYLPFLPLEKEHVKKCLEAEFKRWGKPPIEETIENIIKDVISYDRNHGLFATAGCKKLEKKVALQVMSTKKEL